MAERYEQNPCGSGVDTSSADAYVFLSPRGVVVRAGSQQQFWQDVQFISCTSVKYRLSKALGTISQDGLYTAPSTVGVNGDTVLLTIQSYAKKSLTDTVLIYLAPRTADTCDVTTVRYSSDILPILQNACLGCHSSQSYNRSGGGVNLDSIQNVRTYALNGLLLSSINYSSTFKMPREAERLDSCSIKKVRVWIERGALND